MAERLGLWYTSSIFCLQVFISFLLLSCFDVLCRYTRFTSLHFKEIALYYDIEENKLTVVVRSDQNDLYSFICSFYKTIVTSHFICNYPIQVGNKTHLKVESKELQCKSFKKQQIERHTPVLQNIYIQPQIRRNRTPLIVQIYEGLGFDSQLCRSIIRSVKTGILRGGWSDNNFHRDNRAFSWLLTLTTSLLSSFIPNVHKLIAIHSVNSWPRYTGAAQNTALVSTTITTNPINLRPIDTSTVRYVSAPLVSTLRLH